MAEITRTVVGQIAAAMQDKKQALLEAAIQDIGFPYQSLAQEFEETVAELGHFAHLEKLLAGRRPVCGAAEEVVYFRPWPKRRVLLDGSIQESN